MSFARRARCWARRYRVANARLMDTFLLQFSRFLIRLTDNATANATWRGDADNNFNCHGGVYRDSTGAS